MDYFPYRTAKIAKGICKVRHVLKGLCNDILASFENPKYVLPSTESINNDPGLSFKTEN